MPTSTPAPTAFVTHVCRTIGLLVLLFLLTPTKSHAQTWLVSTDPYVKLGVVDKFGQIGSYTAKFVVTNQTTGKEYILTKQIDSPQKGVDVLFPSEPSEAQYFATSTGEAAKATPGKYVWECQVSGKRVVSGRFTLAPAANDVTVIEK